MDCRLELETLGAGGEIGSCGLSVPPDESSLKSKRVGRGAKPAKMQMRRLMNDDFSIFA